MNSVRSIFSLVTMAATVGSLCLTTPMVLAYEEGIAGVAAVEGVITFVGTPPPPKLFDLKKFGNSKYCSQVDSDGKGHRVVQDVIIRDGRLYDVVVYIRDVMKGKPFQFHGTDVKESGCRWLVQGGPSTFAGVVVRGAEIRILNEDADPDDPKAVTGVLHNPHLYEVAGFASWSLFNLPLPEKGQMVKRQVLPKKDESILKLECDQHNYEQAFFYQVENPYYAIVGREGAYAIDQVPAGKYELMAWHPTLGMQTKTIEVGASGTVTANFEFGASTGRSK